MTGELIGLHSDILSEFEKRLESSEEIPEAVVAELKEAENLGLDSASKVQAAIEDGIRDEAE